MFQSSFDQNAFQKLINEAVDNALKRHAVQNEVPPILTRKQFMELTGVGETKCAELFNREDFPVCREFGYPRVRTEKLFEWMDEHTNWVKDNIDRESKLRVI
ncbi:DNA-binding protein [Halobacillus trueperi]|uniref:DNA-binding protein n=1 Tax=Halobacillus trueperi TaxID=156205 RepID=A0A3D8VLR7_9BACI|nr:DNA-binding protein [Halobacillus trueperi]RDY70285.1 DNA-binding protein [Halobacillus trueperi]